MSVLPTIKSRSGANGKASLRYISVNSARTIVGVIPLPLSIKGLALAPGWDPAKYSIQANESITNDSNSS